MTTCDYCGKTVESEQAAITGIGWVVCPTCAKVYGKDVRLSGQIAR